MILYRRFRLALCSRTPKPDTVLSPARNLSLSLRERFVCGVCDSACFSVTDKPFKHVEDVRLDPGCYWLNPCLYACNIDTMKMMRLIAKRSQANFLFPVLPCLSYHAPVYHISSALQPTSRTIVKIFLSRQHTRASTTPNGVRYGHR